MSPCPPPSDLEAALAQARSLLAAGNRREALLLALNLLHQALETVRRQLVILQHELAQSQKPVTAGSDESRSGALPRLKTTGDLIIELGPQTSVTTQAKRRLAS